MVVYESSCFVFEESPPADPVIDSVVIRVLLPFVIVTSCLLDQVICASEPRAQSISVVRRR